MNNKQKEIELSIVIPIFNEQEAIKKTVEEINRVMGSWPGSWEVILVNDGSTDQTKEKLEEIDHKQIRVIHHKSNHGYGSSLKTGIRASCGRWVAITDCDLTYPLERLSDLFEQAHHGHVMVVGARTGQDVQIPLLRRFPKWVLKKLAVYLSNHDIPDLNSGFRVFDRDSLIPHLALLPDGFSFTTTITLVYLTRGEEVSYVPVDYYGRTGSSKIRPIRDTLLFFQLIIRTITLFQPLKVYVPIAFLCECVAVFIVVFYKLLDVRVPDATVAIFAVAGIMLFCLGLLADLVSRRIGHLHELIIRDLNR